MPTRADYIRITTREIEEFAGGKPIGKEWQSGELEARGGIEPPIKVLQTFALPLGDRAEIESVLFSLERRRPGELTSAAPFPVLNDKFCS
jgi:hypothetical protein